jgi:hypothetical protein
MKTFTLKGVQTIHRSTSANVNIKEKDSGGYFPEGNSIL